MEQSLENIGFTLGHIKHALENAYNVAGYSSCLKKKVGAVMISKIDGELFSLGHGEPMIPCKKCTRKEREWTQDGCWSIHAEPRAIFNYFTRVCSSTFVRSIGCLQKSVMVVTHGPCDQCLKYMAYFGIKIVIYDQDYKTDYKKWEHLIRVYKLKDLEAMFNDTTIKSIQL